MSYQDLDKISGKQKVWKFSVKKKMDWEYPIRDAFRKLINLFKRRKK